ncbi:hypothetical protein HW452_14495 [Halomonas aquamarina]|uniref:Uncharacterized protein n=1 Tax=Vreelandella aquamarina TaxID=77097 RepID=A0ACC5VWS3_9GAMM|nr:hypothetical protein [Halomonas aquamarina]MBZ5488733.1 hypothetical protein [Halomonas aquamarina]
MIDLEFVFFAFSALAIVVGVLTLVIWGVILLFYMEKIDSYFDSPDFPHRGLKGLWPWEMGRAASYGVFVLFHNSRFVRRKFPHAREEINISKLPKKIKIMVLFPMYTYIPSALFILAGGMLLYINKWFF